MTDTTKLAEVKIDSETYNKNYWENARKKNEPLISFTFPDNWSKEDYLEFTRQWKALYRIHSEYARLLKRARKTVHNVLTEDELSHMDNLWKEGEFATETPYNGYFSTYGSKTFWKHPMKVRARILLAMRKASKVWANESWKREQALKQAA